MPADILDLFRHLHLEPVKKTGKEWASPCPACGGEDRCSIWPDEHEGRGAYWCRRCDAAGDGIQLLRDHAGMSYADACARVGVTPAKNNAAPRPPKKAAAEGLVPAKPARADRDANGIDRALWREKASALVAWTHAHLMGNPGQLAWLAARGLDKDAAIRYRLGYNPGERGQNSIIRPRESWGLAPETKPDGKPKRLWIPRGIVIPQITEDTGNRIIRRVRIRRLDADREIFQPKRKYQVVEGSEMDVLFLPCTTPGIPAVVVVVESELDAIMLHHLCGDFVSVIGIMTSAIKNLPLEVFEFLAAASCILVALDFDEPDKNGKRAGADGWPRWEVTYPRARRWPPSTGKDPGEAFAAGDDPRLWLLAGIPEGLRPLMPAGLYSFEMWEKKARQEEKRAVPSQERSGPKGPTRWHGAGAETKLEDAVLPEGSAYTVPYLRQAFAGKAVADNLLVPCPKTKPKWFWLYYKNCSKCIGHPLCLVDFVTSPAMLAPLEEEYV